MCSSRAAGCHADLAGPRGASCKHAAPQQLDTESKPFCHAGQLLQPWQGRPPHERVGGHDCPLYSCLLACHLATVIRSAYNSFWHCQPSIVAPHRFPAFVLLSVIQTVLSFESAFLVAFPLSVVWSINTAGSVHMYKLVRHCQLLMWRCHTRLLALLPQSLKFKTITSLFCSSLLCCRICKLLSCFCQSALCQACTICSATSVSSLSSILIQYTSLCSTCCSVTDFFTATDCSGVPRLISDVSPPLQTRHRVFVFCRSAQHLLHQLFFCHPAY